MATQVTRKLSAILYADAAGYSRLTGADEEGTHRELSAQLDTITGVIEGHGGTVLHYAGDAILAEFASVVVAVECAVAIQRALAGRNADLPGDRRVMFRIGVNLGDVIVDRGEIYGDGVNIAARVQGLAEPGGICISSKVLEEVRDRLEFGYRFLGEQSVKNIARPIPIYAVMTDPAAAGQIIGERPGGSRRRIIAVAALTAAILAAGVLYSEFGPFIAETPAPDIASDSGAEQTAGTTPAAPPTIAGKPSILVLPFANMSGDRGQEYFSDGLTEDLLTDLSKISALRVISRTTAFTLKGKAPDIRAVGKELGVSHVVEGSVRRAGGRVRITVQLTDTATGTHLWAERYDRDLKDIFAVQDDVRGRIVAALAVKLVAGSSVPVPGRGTKSVEAYDLFMRGRHRESSFTRADNAAAIALYEQAIAVDPHYSNAHARLANMLDFKGRNGWGKDAAEDSAKSVQMAEKAIALDNTNPFAHWSLARILGRVRAGGMETRLKAIGAAERAIALDPNYADAYGFLAVLYIGTGRPEAATQAIDTAIKLNPRYPFWYVQNRGIIHYMKGEYGAAAKDFEQASSRNPTADFTRLWLAASYAQAGRPDDASWQIDEIKVLGRLPTVREAVERNAILRHPPYIELYAAGLRKAGLPE